MRKLTFCLLLVASSTALAADHNLVGFKCHKTTEPEKFVRAWIDHGYVLPASYVNVDGSPYYSVKPGWTFYGFPLVAITGWAEGGYFERMPVGTEPPKFLQIVVQGQTPDVWNKLREGGAEFGSSRMMDIRNFSDPLPPKANPHYAYVSITCYPNN
jgi:hypothetical protein